METLRTPSASAPNICWVLRPSLMEKRGSGVPVVEITRTTRPSIGLAQETSKRKADFACAANGAASNRRLARSRITRELPLHSTIPQVGPIIVFRGQASQMHGSRQTTKTDRLSYLGAVDRKST